MLATGASLVLAYESLVEKHGRPDKLHVAVGHRQRGGAWSMPRSTCRQPEPPSGAGAVDAELTVHSYIVPGLGDAGDLAYGPKTEFVLP